MCVAEVVAVLVLEAETGWLKLFILFYIFYIK